MAKKALQTCESTPMMKVSADPPIRKSVPNAGSLPRPWLWQIWVAVFIAFILALAAHFIFRTQLALSSPSFLTLGDTCTVTSEATNNTRQRVEASLVFTIGVGRNPKTGSGRYADLGRRTVSIVLAPGEHRAVSCEFSLADHQRPNIAQVEVESSNIPNQ